MSKRAEKHITDEDVKRTLPHNRKEVFFDLLKYRKMTLFALSCFVFMFFIPLAVDLFYFNFSFNKTYPLFMQKSTCPSFI